MDPRISDENDNSENSRTNGVTHGFRYLENISKSPKTMKKTSAKNMANKHSSSVICNCAICLEPIKGNMVAATKFEKKLERPIAVLSCGHSFHLDCIGNTFNAKKVMECPCCRETQPGEWKEDLRRPSSEDLDAERSNRVDLFVSIQRAVLFRELLNLPRPRANSAPVPPVPELVMEPSPRTTSLASASGVQSDQRYSEPGLVVVTTTDIDSSSRRRRPRRPRALSLNTDPTDSANRNPFRRRTRRRLNTDVPGDTEEHVEELPRNNVCVNAPLTPVVRRVVNLAKAEIELLQRELAHSRSTEASGLQDNRTSGTESNRTILQSRRNMLKEALGMFRLSEGFQNNRVGINAEEMQAASMWLKRHITDAQSELRRLHRSEASREAALLRRIGVLREFSAIVGHNL